MSATHDTALPPQAGQSGGEILLVSFRLGTEEFGIEIAKVQEILKMPDITPIPRSPEHLSGITNIRGSILPVIDAKMRLKLSRERADERNRVLVVSHAGALTGMIVDEVHEVMRIDSGRIEAPPAVTRGIDRFYLSGIVKLDEGRLVMMLNLDEFLHVEIRRQETQQVLGREATAASETEHVPQVQLVSFYLGNDEFAFDIAAVHEIIRAREITAVPNVPDFVVGIQTLRNAILPVIDLRRIVQKRDLGEENLERLARMKQAHLEWLQALEESLRAGTPFTKTTDPTKCELGLMLADRQLSGAHFRKFKSRIQPPHTRMHASAVTVRQLAETDLERARRHFEEQTLPDQREVVRILDDESRSIADGLRREQKILILESRGATFGLLVDRINEVLRVPANTIDSTPALISSYGRELKGVAKLAEGARLIMILDEHSMISQQEAETLSQIGERDQAAQHKGVQVQLNQYVVFSIHGEEYGIAIDRVREIFKIVEITPVPKAPDFVAGLTNLRGTIIPVIDVRRRFGLPDVHQEYVGMLREIDERFRATRRAVEEHIAGGRWDDARQAAETSDLARFLTAFKADNDGIAAHAAEWQTEFTAIQAGLLKAVQLLGRNRERGQAFFDGAVRGAMDRFAGRLQAGREQTAIGLLKSEKILVVSAQAMAIGLLMDSVHEVVSIPVAAVEPAPELVLSQIDSGYLQGIAKLAGGQRMVLLLNIDEILSRAQFQKLLSLQPAGTAAEDAAAPAKPAAARRDARRKLRIEE